MPLYKTNSQKRKLICILLGIFIFLDSGIYGVYKVIEWGQFVINAHYGAAELPPEK